MNTFPLAGDAWPQHWWFLFFPLIWLVAIVLVIRFAVVRRGGCWGRGRAGRPGLERARGILAERYARGEIGEDEYRTRLDRLRADAQT